MLDPTLTVSNLDNGIDFETTTTLSDMIGGLESCYERGTL